MSSNSVRVYELAKEVGLENRDVIRRLADLGVEAKSHSSSVSVVDAKRLKDSIGRSAEEREREEVERRRREQEELERYRTVEQLPASTKRKAAKVLPPHMREQQAKEADAVASATASAASDAEAPSAPDAPTTAAPSRTTTKRKGTAPDVPGADDAGTEGADSTLRCAPWSPVLPHRLSPGRHRPPKGSPSDARGPTRRCPRRAAVDA